MTEKTKTTNDQAAAAAPARKRGAPGEDSAIRVLEALAKASGDVILRSKLDTGRRIRIAQKITELAAPFGELHRQAFPDLDPGVFAGLAEGE